MDQSISLVDLVFGPLSSEQSAIIQALLVGLSISSYADLLTALSSPFGSRQRGDAIQCASIQDAHAKLAQCRLRYLRILGDDKQATLLHTLQDEPGDDGHPLLNYAIVQWINHTRESKDRFRSIWQNLNDLFDQQNGRYQVSYARVSGGHCSDTFPPTALHICAKVRIV